MTILAGFILVFSLVQFLVALSNLVFNQGPAKSADTQDDLVSVLIPARNEEQNIGNILDDLIRQDYQKIEVLVFDDLSEDHTTAIVKSFAGKDRRIKLVQSKGLPEGWLGKNFACHSLSQYANGSYILFLDADVRIQNHIIADLLLKVKKHHAALLSVFPAQTMQTIGEKATVPLMNYILLSLLPLILVRKLPFASMAASNGQFMLFNVKKYRSVLPHERLKASSAEDIETARLFKRTGFTVICLTGLKSVGCRMYSNYKEAIRGFSKNVATLFGNSLLLAILFWLITTLGFIPVFTAFSNGIFPGYIMIILLTRIFVSLTSRQSVITNLIYLLPQQLSLGLIIIKSVLNKLKGKFEWKGRNIYSLS